MSLDIRIGDTVRQTVTFPSGDTIIRQFKVVKGDDDDTWVEGVDVGVALTPSAHDTRVTEVIDRPVPVEPTTLGTIITFERRNGAPKISLLLTEPLNRVEPLRHWLVIGLDGKPYTGPTNAWKWSSVVDEAVAGTLTITEPVL